MLRIISIDIRWTFRWNNWCSTNKQNMMIQLSPYLDNKENLRVVWLDNFEMICWILSNKWVLNLKNCPLILSNVSMVSKRTFNLERCSWISTRILLSSSFVVSWASWIEFLLDGWVVDTLAIDERFSFVLNTAVDWFK